jgi:hypothetical protein
MEAYQTSRQVQDIETETIACLALAKIYDEGFESYELNWKQHDQEGRERKRIMEENNDKMTDYDEEGETNTEEREKPAITWGMTADLAEQMGLLVEHLGRIATALEFGIDNGLTVVTPADRAVAALRGQAHEMQMKLQAIEEEANKGPEIVT